MCERGECDFVRDIAAPLPMAVIGDMLGVLPDEREMFLKWSDDMVSRAQLALSSEADIQVTMDAFAAYNGYTTDMIDQAPSRADRRPVLRPGPRGGRGSKLSDDEIVMETLLILIGGDETTRHTLSGGTEQLLRHRDQWRVWSDDPDLLPGAIEEMLRWTSPVKNMCRTLTADTEFHGTAAQGRARR